MPGSTEDQALRAWLTREASIGMSAVAWAEFLCGPVGQTDKAAARLLIGAPVPLEEASAELAASLFNATGRRGTLGDCLIAAIALQAGARLATVTPPIFAGSLERGLSW